MPEVQLVQEPWDHTNDFSAGAERAVGESAHHAAPPSAEDQCDAAGGQKLAQAGGGGSVCR
jgi:hypothetical protein